MSGKKTAIIFGSAGQDGFYLKNILSKNNINTIGISRSEGDIIGSVGEMSLVSSVLSKFRPDYIFHLAAISSTKEEFNTANFFSIEVGTFNILETVRKLNLSARVFISGSAFQFKNLNKPINELTPLQSDDFYSFSRNQSLEMARYFRDKYEQKIYFGFLFNHDSPRRPDTFFCKKMSNLAQNYANKNLREKTFVGDLSYSREFSFAGDIMEAVFKLISQEKVYEAVVGSGLAFSLKDWVSACFHRHSMDFENFIDYEFNDNGHVLVSSPIVMKSLGWTPHYDFEAVVELMC